MERIRSLRKNAEAADTPEEMRCPEKTEQKDIRRADAAGASGSCSAPSAAEKRSAGEEASETSITVFSYAKINLSLDVGPVRPDGYHPVDMIMQQLLFHDDVRVSFEEGKVPGEHLRRIVLSSNRSDVPKDSRNLAWRAAELLSKRAGTNVPEGKIRIEIVKRIPVAAGLAGGSGNGAAALHALNALWKLNLTLSDLMEEGAKLGADVPFCVMGQAAGNLNLPKNIRTDPAAASAARATGTGIILSPVHSRRMPLVFAKPDISVSTAEVYRGIDDIQIFQHPNNGELANCLENDTMLLYHNCINVLENYTLAHYPETALLKKKMQNLGGEWTLMSGSGPTVFTIFRSVSDAKRASEILKDDGYEAYWTETMA